MCTHQLVPVGIIAFINHATARIIILCPLLSNLIIILLSSELFWHIKCYEKDFTVAELSSIKICFHSSHPNSWLLTNPLFLLVYFHDLQPFPLIYFEHTFLPLFLLLTFITCTPGHEKGERKMRNTRELPLKPSNWAASCGEECMQWVSRHSTAACSRSSLFSSTIWEGEKKN